MYSHEKDTRNLRVVLHGLSRVLVIPNQEEHLAHTCTCSHTPCTCHALSRSLITINGIIHGIGLRLSSLCLWLWHARPLPNPALVAWPCRRCVHATLYSLSTCNPSLVKSGNRLFLAARRYHFHFVSNSLYGFTLVLSQLPRRGLAGGERTESSVCTKRSLWHK